MEFTHNQPEYSVSQIAGQIKRVVETAFGQVRVRGELSKVSINAASGHAYLTLKDDKAVLDAVCWRGVLARLSHKPEAGMEVIVSGKLTTYPGSSKYQLVIESLEPAGIGALMAMLEKRKAQLAAEGLFDAARKKPLPYLPEVIGVITSPTGAVIRDILHRIADRFPRHVILWPVAVQGKGAAEQIAAAIAGFNALPLPPHAGGGGGGNLAAGAGAAAVPPLTSPPQAGGIIIDKDGTIRANSTPEDLAKLAPVFDAKGTVTAATSSPLTDGAAAVLVVSEAYAKKHKLPILARITSMAVAGLDPAVMGLGPVYATNKALARAGLAVKDLDIIEINEAFAAQSIPCCNELGFDMKKVNIEGGAIALGHPLGASGARITGKAALLLARDKKAKYALATACIGGGQGIATILEKV